MKRIILTVAAAVVVCIGTRTTSGAVIYSQVTPAQPIGASTSEDGATGQKVADNFVLNASQATTVRSLRLIGGYGVTSPPPQTPPLDSLPMDDFRVLFLNDAGGSPGSAIPGGDFAVGLPVQRTPTGGRLLNGIVSPIAYALDLGDGVTLNPNTVYWISILNTTRPNNYWVWARAGGSYDQSDAATYDDPITGPWSVFTEGGMYFSLNDVNVPEPPALAMLLTGIFFALAGLCAGRLRALNAAETLWSRRFSNKRRKLEKGSWKKLEKVSGTVY